MSWRRPAGGRRAQGPPLCSAKPRGRRRNLLEARAWGHLRAARQKRPQQAPTPHPGQPLRGSRPRSRSLGMSLGPPAGWEEDRRPTRPRGRAGTAHGAVPFAPGEAVASVPARLCGGSAWGGAQDEGKETPPETGRGPRAGAGGRGRLWGRACSPRPVPPLLPALRDAGRQTGQADHIQPLPQDPRTRKRAIHHNSKEKEDFHSS